MVLMTLCLPGFAVWLVLFTLRTVPAATLDRFRTDVNMLDVSFSLLSLLLLIFLVGTALHGKRARDAAAEVARSSEVLLQSILQSVEIVTTQQTEVLRIVGNREPSRDVLNAEARVRFARVLTQSLYGDLSRLLMTAGKDMSSASAAEGYLLIQQSYSNGIESAKARHLDAMCELFRGVLSADARVQLSELIQQRLDGIGNVMYRDYIQHSTKDVARLSYVLNEVIVSLQTLEVGTVELLGRIIP